MTIEMTAKDQLQKFMALIKTAPTSFDDCVAALSEICQPGICWELPKGSGPVMGGKHIGIEKNAKLLSSVFTDVYSPNGFQCTVHELFGEEHAAAARYQIKATTIGGYDYSNEYAITVRARDGKLTHIWEYLDTIMAANQIFPKIEKELKKEPEKEK